MSRIHRFLLTVILVANPIPAPASDQTESSAPNWWQQLRSCPHLDLQALSLITVTGLAADSVANPGNTLARLPEHEFSAEVRPEFRCDATPLSLTFGPRLTQRTGFAGSYPQAATDLYVQDWTVRAKLLPTVTASYGREVLQWGPSMLVSPSNPFHRDNGKGNPLREIPALEFFRAVWVPSSRWSISYITNTALGRSVPDDSPFRAVHALKMDRRGDSFAATAIVSRPAGGRVTTGASIQRTVNDALVVYAEGSVRQGSTGLYPVRTPDAPGWLLLETKRASDAVSGSALLGALYTTANGSTWNLEYLTGRDGYSSSEAATLHTAEMDLAQALASTKPASERAAAVLASAMNLGLRTLRRNYMFAQFLQTGIHDKVDLTLRYTLGLDDGGGTAVGYMNWSVGDRVQIVGLVTAMSGGPASEFARVIHYQVLAGVRLWRR
jgi:hypothetical protein